MLMSVEQEDQCEDFRPMPWDSRSCPMVKLEELKETIDVLEKDTHIPGVDLHGGAEVPQNVKTVADTTVVMVMASLDSNNSKSVELDSSVTGVYHETVVPDVTRSHKELMTQGQQIPGNFSTELETA